MKFARKLSLFVALALIVTIGGVYAAWIYPADNAMVSSATKTFTGNMTQVQTQATSKGTIALDTATDTLKLFVDDQGGYVAGLTAQGSFTVVFTPLAGVSTDIRENGINLQLQLTITGAQNKYEHEAGGEQHQATVLAPAATNTITVPKTALTKNGDNFSYTFEADDILNLLTFCEGHTVVLGTLAENTAFEELLNSYTINLTISEAP